MRSRAAKNAINTVTNIPMMNPEIVTAISLMLLFVFEFIKEITSPSFGHFDMNLKEMISDTDPRFVVGYNTYIKK